MQYNSAILYPAYIYKYIYEYKYLYIFCTGKWTSLFFLFFLFFLMWNLKESSSYCGFTWGIVIQWPCLYLNQKCLREWEEGNFHFCSNRRDKLLKIGSEPQVKFTLWVEQVRSSKKRHFKAHVEMFRHKMNGGGFEVGNMGQELLPVFVPYQSLSAPLRHLKLSQHLDPTIPYSSKLAIGVGGFIYSKYSDPVEPKRLLMLNVCHTRRKTANQI